MTMRMYQFANNPPFLRRDFSRPVKPCGVHGDIPLLKPYPATCPACKEYRGWLLDVWVRNERLPMLTKRKSFVELWGIKEGDE